MTDEIEKPVFDLEEANALLGKIMLVGITYFDEDNNLLYRRQVFGTVVAVCSQQGIGLLLEGSNRGKKFTLPPDLSSVKEAPAGTYSLKETGEIVENPDYLATWNCIQSDRSR